MDSFTRSYIETALWSTNDNSDESGGEPLDQNYDIADIDDETVEDMTQDCKDFQEQNADDLDLVSHVSDGGHDFWLTRNGHGAGFWGHSGTPDVEAALNRLTKSSKAYGGYDLYVGDDGKIHAGGFTRSSRSRYEKQKRIETAVLTPHARCIKRCEEHAIDPGIPSCKRRRRS